MTQDTKNTFAELMKAANTQLAADLSKNKLHNKIVQENVLKAASEAETPEAAPQIIAPVTPEKITLSWIEILWNEGSEQLDGTILTNWTEAQEALKKIGLPLVGYNKTGLLVSWNGRQIKGRIDIGLAAGDFNPYRETIGSYLQNSTFTKPEDKTELSFEDSDEVKQQADQIKIRNIKPKVAATPAQETPAATPEIITTPTPAAAKPALELYDYSEKAFAIIGDTKPIKDQLMKLGGRYNRNLRCGAGWIFSKKRLDSVKQALSL